MLINVYKTYYVNIMFLRIDEDNTPREIIQRTDMDVAV